jgi:uncharacterized protein (DUF3084 family)
MSLDLNTLDLAEIQELKIKRDKAFDEAKAVYDEVQTTRNRLHDLERKVYKARQLSSRLDQKLVAAIAAWKGQARKIAPETIVDSYIKANKIYAD